MICTRFVDLSETVLNTGSSYVRIRTFSTPLRQSMVEIYSRYFVIFSIRIIYRNIGNFLYDILPQRLMNSFSVQWALTKLRLRKRVILFCHSPSAVKWIWTRVWSGGRAFMGISPSLIFGINHIARSLRIYKIEKK